jgi:hypothetical protein
LLLLGRNARALASRPHALCRGTQPCDGSLHLAGGAEPGRGFLDWLNAGKFADGGAAVTGLGIGSYEISPTDDGGAIINGVAHPPGDPILNDPIVKQALARARAAKQDEKPRHKSDFTGTFGGHEFDTPGGYAEGGAVGRVLQRLASGGSVGNHHARIASVFANGGFVDIAPHFALGGLADAAADAISGGPAPSLDLKGTSPWDNVPHLGSADLRTNHGDVRAVGPKEILKALVREARDSENASTGRNPSWQYGR